jgi:hypothetical protein
MNWPPSGNCVPAQPPDPLFFSHVLYYKMTPPQKRKQRNQNMLPTEIISMRLSRRIMEALDRWRRERPGDLVSRSAAIREILEKTLGITKENANSKKGPKK